MHTPRQKLAVTSAKLARVNSHGEGLACKVAQALLCDGLEMGWLIVLWGVLMVSQLHEEVSLWRQQQECVGAVKMCQACCIENKSQIWDRLPFQIRSLARQVYYPLSKKVLYIQQAAVFVTGT